jgi:hypothetical protein
MSITYRSTLFLLLLLLLLPLGPLTAQSQTLSPAIDVSLGLGRGYGGPGVPDRGMVSGSALLSKPVRALARGALVVAANASASLLWSTTDCLTDLAAGPSGCRDFPSHASVDVLGGWVMRAHQGSGVRLLAGPGYFTTSDSRSGIGMTARLDGAARMTPRLSFVFWTQAQIPPATRGERLTVASAGIGVRVHGHRAGPQ